MSLTGLILHGLETDGKFNPGRAAEIPAGGGAGAATSPFDPTALHHEATVLTGQGKGRCQAGARQVPSCSCRWKKVLNKTHLETNAEINVKNTGTAEKACTI